ncbi:MAG: hypothetical protein EBS39_12340, partial [Gammaproteobacteria bacterium]|nr:hypothetical protein [Gammaproteobacteria bacterium]
RATDARSAALEEVHDGLRRGLADLGDAAVQAIMDLLERRAPRVRGPVATLAIRESTRPLG